MTRNPSDSDASGSDASGSGASRPGASRGRGPSAVALPPTAAKLLSLFRRGEALTYDEITARLPIGSKRQARRLVGRLREENIPLEDQRRGRKKEFLLPPEEQATHAQLDLTEREALALMLAAGSARSGLGPAPLEEALEGAAQKLSEELSRVVTTFEPAGLMEQLHFGEAASVEVDPEVFTSLLGAVANRRAVEIDYYSASSDERAWRRVDPWGLAVRGDAWLCVGYDPRHEEPRDFNLSRVHGVRPADPESPGADYQIPEGFDLELYFADRFEALDDEEVRLVQLLLEPQVISYFKSKQYHRTQQVNHDHPAFEERPGLDPNGNRAIASYEVAGLEEISAFVRSWGPKVKVLAPEALAERIAADARSTVGRYDDNGPL